MDNPSFKSIQLLSSPDDKLANNSSSGNTQTDTEIRNNVSTQYNTNDRLFAGDATQPAGQPDYISGDYNSGSGIRHKITSGGSSASGGFSSITADPCGDGSIGYAFRGGMSRDVLERYLSKSLNMQGMSDPNRSDNDKRPDDLRMILNVGAKYIGRIAYSWNTASNAPGVEAFFKYLQQLKADTDYLHKRDCDIICEAAILEWVDPPINTYAIPDYVKSDLFNARIIPHIYDTHFNFDKIKFDDTDPDRNDGLPNCPDITKDHTKMWFYYLATQYIDHGCEALHLGQIGTMAKKDSGYQIVWSLLQIIRKYASTHARRQLVLCNAHCQHGAYVSTATTLSWEKQLLFDFHAQGVFPSKNNVKLCIDNVYLPVVLLTDKDATTARKKDHGLVNRSEGGKNPLGWYCKENPYFLEFDNYIRYQDDYPTVGCSVPDSSWEWDFYGFDQIGFLAVQSEEYRNLTLRYLHYKLRCLDKNGYLQMPGRRNLVIPKIPPYTYPGHKPESGNPTYRANTGDYSQEETIKQIWNGTFFSGNKWVPHNFTAEEVMNDIAPQVASSLIRVGNDKIYYIGFDGYIHGYVRYHEVWLTVSPSYSAMYFYSQDISAQGKAQSDLVASPDGDWLLYLGTDGRFYRFSVIDPWRYMYGWSFMSPSSVHRNVVPGTVIYPGNDRIYYVEIEAHDGSKRMHGFQKSGGYDWRTVSPSYSAQFSFGQSVNSQIQVAGGLSYEWNASPHRIYYRSDWGHLAYYEVVNLVDYRYVYFSHNHLLMDNHVQIVGNLGVNGNRIYFVGYNPPSHQFKIYCLACEPTWLLLDISSSTPGSPLQSDIAGQIAVSPNGKTIIYFAKGGPSLCFFIISSAAINYDTATLAYRPHSGPRGSHPPYTNYYHSLQFYGNDEIFCANTDDKTVWYLKYNENYCGNNVINEVEGRR